MGSRVAASLSSSRNSADIDFTALASVQQDDAEIIVLHENLGALHIREVPIPSCAVPVLCHLAMPSPRLIIPTNFQRIVFNACHRLSHPGIQATQHLLTQRFVWPGINKDVREWTRCCLVCQQSKVSSHTKAPFGSFMAPTEHFDKVHVDILGPGPPSKGNTNLLTCVDRFTCWPEAFPLPDIRSETIANAFVAGGVSRYGVPSTITTDRGRQFESALFNNLLTLLGTSRIRTTAYHPIANGLVERFHRSFKTALRAQPDATDWSTSLPLVLLSLRATLKQDLHCTPAEMVFGAPLRLPGEFFTASES